MPSLELRLLGGFEVRTTDGPSIGITAKKVRALLAYLALPPGRPHPREKLAALIWGDVSQDEQARRSLRQALTTLRRSLPEGALETDRDTLALRPSANVDVERFERLAVSRERGELEAAVELYRGELMEGFSARADAFDEWLGRQRVRLRELALAASERLCELQHEARELEPALATAMRLVAMDPLREAGHRQLMRLYEESGRASEALRQFNTLRDLLGDELGAEPDPETVALVERMRTGSERRAPSSHAREQVSTQSEPELRQICAVCAMVSNPVLSGELCGRGVALLERFGATVVRASADRVLGALGLARSTGSEAEYAVRAGLALAEAFGVGAVRVGIASGQVLREPGRSPALQGDVLRSALELAERGVEGVTVSAAIARALGQRLKLASSPSGSASRQRVLGILGADEAFRGSPFVGRTSELSQLSAALELSKHAGRGRVFIVRGEAGIGKTRLVTELRARALLLGFAVHTRALVDFGRVSEHEPMTSLVREWLGAAADALEALTSAVAASIVPSADVPLLLDVLEALPRAVRELDPASRDEHLRRRRDAVARLLEAQSRRAPRLVWMDDVHWADRATLAQVAAFLPVAARVPLVLVLTTRHEGPAESAEFRASLRGNAVTTLDLAPLTRDEAAELARELGAAHGASRLDSTLDRAGGNPLFLEQLLRADDRGPLPDSVQSLIQSRTDGLEARQRATLGAAAILGQRFTLAALGHLLGVQQPELEPLLLEGLVLHDDDGLRFAHVLLREGVYESLTEGRRAELHRLAAGFYASRDATLRAQHLDRAGAAEASAAYAAAAAAELRAGKLESAEALCARGFEIASSQRDRFTLALQWGEVLCDLGRLEEALRAFEQARAAAQSPLDEARALVGLAAALRVLDRSREALAALSQAEQLVDPLRDAALMSRIHYLRGNVLFPLGDPSACLRSHTLALETAQSAQSMLAEARALSGIADAHYISGRFSTARAWFARCEDCARAAGALDLELSSRGMLAIIDLAGPKLRDARADCAVVAERYRAFGMLRGEALMLTAAAWGSLFLGECRAALEHARRAVDLAARIGAQRFEALGLAYAVMARCELETAPDVRADLERATELAHASGIGFAGGAVYAARLAAERDPERLKRLLDDAERQLTPSAMQLALLTFVHHGLPAALRIGEPERAHRYADLVARACAAEPHPLGADLANLCRGLAAWCSGERGGALQGALSQLRVRLREAELHPALELLERNVGRRVV